MCSGASETGRRLDASSNAQAALSVDDPRSCLDDRRGWSISPAGATNRIRRAADGFGAVEVRSSPGSAEYIARCTSSCCPYSDHIELDPATRERLFDGLSELIRTRYRGLAEKHYETVLYVAPVRTH